MNRGLIVTLAIISTLTSSISGFVHDVLGGASIRSSTPSSPNKGGHHRYRPHAPNDGKWHMKYHRGRH